MLTTTIAPSSGRAYVAGFDVAADPSAARRASAVVFQESVLDRALTGRRNLAVHARLGGLGPTHANTRIASHQGDLTVNTPPKNEPERILVVGRSPSVLVAAVDILRAKGYSADATNQFDQVLDDYDVTELDVLVFGGMVPADTKQQLRENISERNPHVIFVQGLAGIAGLIAAQVQAATSAETPDSGEAVYDAAQRSVQLTLKGSAPVSVEAWWHTSFVPPEPNSASMHVFDGQLDAGSHIIPLPDQVPSEASFVGVTVGSFARVFTVGPLPNAVTRLVPASAADNRLPQVSQVTTSNDDR